MDVYEARNKFRKETGQVNKEAVADLNWPIVIRMTFKDELEKIFALIDEAIKNKEREKVITLEKIKPDIEEHEIYALKRYLVEAKGFDVQLSYTRDFTEVRRFHISGWARFI